jgi:predicted kinase
MPCLYLVCGKVGTGKTTYAKRLEETGEAICFSVDEWMIHFYGHHLPSRDQYNAGLDKSKEMTFRICEKLLKNNCNVVLDFGFWKRAERDYVRERFFQWEIKLLFLNREDNEVKNWIIKRNADLPEYSYEITEEMYEIFSGWFEVPTEDENPIII